MFGLVFWRMGSGAVERANKIPGGFATVKVPESAADDVTRDIPDGAPAGADARQAVLCA